MYERALSRSVTEPVAESPGRDDLHPAPRALNDAGDAASVKPQARLVHGWEARRSSSTCRPPSSVVDADLGRHNAGVVGLPAERSAGTTLHWRSALLALGLGLALALSCRAVLAAEPVHLTILAAGTLARPFKQLDALFAQKYPNAVPQPQFGGSVKMVRQITDLHQPADVLAVADYSVIPKYMFATAGKPGHAAWYAGFARNAITFMYTKASKGAADITPEIWYKILARPGVQIGRSNPDTDPSGYQTLQMLQLAGHYYKTPDLAEQILANAPPNNMRDTETSLIAALQLGQIDYLAIYRSDALQHHLEYIHLPPEIDLSDPKDAQLYKQSVAHTRNGALAGKPIVYAVTIPTGAPNPDLAAKYVALLLGPDGQRIMQENGFGTLAPPYAVNVAAMPAGLKGLVAPWPEP